MNTSRRRFLALAGGALGAAALGADAFLFEPEHVQLSRHDVRIPGLPRGLEGLRIAQISDVHFPGNRLAADAVVAHLKRERPEIVVLTGDMIEHRRALPQVAEFARYARGSIATVATLGNWEYYSESISPLAEVYREAQIALLVNARREVSVGNRSIVLVGLDDPVMGRPDIYQARAGLASGAVEVWLVHAPGIVSRRLHHENANPAFLLAGHTHGGQVRLPFVPAVTPSGSGRFVAGWYRDTFAPLYVSRGVGTTTIPARFRCPPELPIFTLHAT
ncbi:MAG: metallophosphoesterase [Gemmatimonadales bacterium]